MTTVTINACQKAMDLLDATANAVMIARDEAYAQKDYGIITPMDNKVKLYQAQAESLRKLLARRAGK